jgi:hypothetical protein
VIKKPRGRGGHSPRWAALPRKIIIILIINEFAMYAVTRNTKLLHSLLFTVYRFKEFFVKPLVFLPYIVISRIFFVEMFTLSGQLSEWGMLKEAVVGVRREISWIIRHVISLPVIYPDHLQQEG